MITAKQKWVILLLVIKDEIIHVLEYDGINFIISVTSGGFLYRSFILQTLV
jgi:hypothetical protein